MGPPGECWGGSRGVRREKQGSCDSHGAGRQGELSMKRRDGQGHSLCWGQIYGCDKLLGKWGTLSSGVQGVNSIHPGLGFAR